MEKNGNTKTCQAKRVLNSIEILRVNLLSISGRNLDCNKTDFDYLIFFM